jgi:hypothetical protein
VGLPRPTRGSRTRRLGRYGLRENRWSMTAAR